VDCRTRQVLRKWLILGCDPKVRIFEVTERARPATGAMYDDADHSNGLPTDDPLDSEDLHDCPWLATVWQRCQFWLFFSIGYR